MCLLVTNAPSSSLAVGALERLDFVLSFFEHSVLFGSHPAADILVRLSFGLIYNYSQTSLYCQNAMRSLHRQGHEAMDNYRSPNRTETVTGQDRNLEELSRLGAMTQRLSTPGMATAVPAASTDSSPNSAGPSHPIPIPSQADTAGVPRPASINNNAAPHPQPTAIPAETAYKYDFTPITPFGRHRTSTSSTSATLPNPTSSSLYNIFDYTSSDSQGNRHPGQYGQTQDIASVHRSLAKVASSSRGAYLDAEFTEPSSMFVGMQGLGQYASSSTSRAQSDSPPTSSTTAQTPLILDATWQDFVEQLGF